MGILSAARGWSRPRHCHPRMGQEAEVTSTAGSCCVSSLALFQLQISSDQPHRSLTNSPQVTTGIMEDTGPKIWGLSATFKPLGHQVKLAMMLFLALDESPLTCVPVGGPDMCISTP